MIPFNFRFHGHGGLKAVYSSGKVVRTHFATLKYITATRPVKIRIAVVVSKKVIKSAVKRNRIRRRIYEYIRIQSDKLIPGSDIVVIVTSREFLEMSSRSLQKELNQLFESANLYKQQ